MRQANIVKDKLLTIHPRLDITIIPIQTTGDTFLNQNLSDIGGKGLFIKEIEDQLLAGTIDIAVHSLKDMPATLPDGLEIMSVLPREDARDVLLSFDASTVLSLPPQASLGTSSPRRAAQILYQRPDIRVSPFRGNVPTRISKFQSQSPVSNTVLAMAGINRLGICDLTYMHPISLEDMLPAIAQGAIGIEVHKHNIQACSLVSPLNHPLSFTCVQAERLFLGYFEQASCRTPIAAHAYYLTPTTLMFTGLIAAPDGSKLYRSTKQCTESDLPLLALDIAKQLKSQAGEHFFDS